jgi:hypothetical protein
MQSKKTPRWIHPVHARGVKSPQFDGASGPLTDKKIDEYILRGHYGEELQKVLLEGRKKKTKKFVFEDVLKMILGI